MEDPERPSANTEYVTADGGRLPNLGEKSIKATSEEGVTLAIKFQVANMDTPLIAVSKLTAAGHEVSFNENSGAITNKANGRTTAFKRKNNVYVLQIWVKRHRPPSTVAAIWPNNQMPGGRRQ
jgi:hypothetical protein